MARALALAGATCVGNWEENWIVGQFVRSEASSMWLWARAKRAAAGGFRVEDSSKTSQPNFYAADRAPETGSQPNHGQVAKRHLGTLYPAALLVEF